MNNSDNNLNKDKNDKITTVKCVVL